ncbi:11630_t:CDS:2 [Paraglomus brasilianum]|uniref:11630_t:CDS:1 n=1 Tax=Paraglomus brasilianum TaxID=144538 RepID=A0A9N9BRH8_9GLOM|nr:11630_t:CDS:2 [Paraglomus brasilianum]
MKYHVAILNFIPSLTIKDRMVYAYVALGYTSENTLCVIMSKIHSAGSRIYIAKASNKEITEADCTAFAMFLEELKEDYQNASPQLCTALDKFAEISFSEIKIYSSAYFLSL